MTYQLSHMVREKGYRRPRALACVALGMEAIPIEIVDVTGGASPGRAVVLGLF